jgi:SPP1 family predicted phage head-tail adaptor
MGRLPDMPPLEIGRRTQRVTAQNLVETVDQYGQPIQSWTNAFTDWARIRPPTGREQVNADQLKAELSYVVNMNFWPKPGSPSEPALSVTDQLLWGTRTLRITYVRPDEMRQSMDLYCVEQVATL